MKFFIKIIFRATMISIIKFRNIYPSGNRISSQKSTLIERGTEYQKRCIESQNMIFTMKIQQLVYETLCIPKITLLNVHFSLVEEVVILRTLAFHKHKTNLRLPLPLIHCESFETRSTNTTTNDHYLYYSDIKYLTLDMRTITPRTTCSIPLFQNINSLFVYMQPMSPLASNDALNTGKKKMTFLLIT